MPWQCTNGAFVLCHEVPVPTRLRSRSGSIGNFTLMGNLQKERGARATPPHCPHQHPTPRVEELHSGLCLPLWLNCLK